MDLTNFNQFHQRVFEIILGTTFVAGHEFTFNVGFECFKILEATVFFGKFVV